MARPQWFVLDMDEGLIRREPTRTAAVDWCCTHAAGEVLERHDYGPGAYGYSFGIRGEERSVFLCIEREDVAAVGGWGGLDEDAKYPYADDPYQQREDSPATAIPSTHHNPARRRLMHDTDRAAEREDEQEDDEDDED